MWLKPWDEPELEREVAKKWRDRSMLFWVGLVTGAYALVLIAASILNSVVPAPHWGDIAEHGCVARDSLLVYYVCEGFAGAALLEYLRNMPLQFIYMLTFYPFVGFWWPLIKTVAVIIGLAWGLRAVARLIG